ncbi:ornithine cyclodeaminase family protein [Halomicrococcus gelatinilyticus]|uniref:ornithine cyclodeaminase family protein n=1 Tax=Halomicrococcus gelatinilyticus TaxID=1702103 RepID=UPI002E0E09D6
MVRILSDADVADCLDVAELLPVVRSAFVSQGRGEVERPERPHFPVGTGLSGDEPLGTGLVMPAYVHGADYYVTKLASVHEDNPRRDLPTVNAQVALTDAETGQPAALLAGNRITNARTGCIGGLAVAELAAAPVTLGVLGAGTQARWQTRCVDAATDLDAVRVYSPSDSKYACADDLDAELDATVEAVETPADAVAEATAIVTATTSTEPVFDGTDLADGAVVVAVGAYTPAMRELDAATFERAARVFADVPGEAADVGGVRAADLAADELVPLSEAFEGRAGRERADEVLVVESVGSAVLDAAASEHVLQRAIENDVGTTVPL